MEPKDNIEDVGEKVVYIRPVEAADLPEDVQEELSEQAPGLTRLFAVHNSDGERLALVRDRATAFILARENDLAPVTVH
ncbi:DUF1150 family protein [Pseudooceanicola sediminis]|uniref:DUF1150 family protein n=1 Tax=Pseudooceanicola sediminis TaxID=2211117 RepID=A0A399IW37_9RHOB|nr:DUF1150 family protein [Pseudooceanicola sediminis]KAA2312329.1 DUF1150 family protein [Puniceibacterium sp. HSS470]RII37383.1 DUF1150 family protein [Pseudooceanicola sediminis]|tara:strand:- start:322 stop:558 length:237 start_codon:yes stop_codon:yes gene_type:complete